MAGGDRDHAEIGRGLAPGMAVAAVGALPMLIHGYFIVFEGRRLV